VRDTRGVRTAQSICTWSGRNVERLARGRHKVCAVEKGKEARESERVYLAAARGGGHEDRLRGGLGAVLVGVAADQCARAQVLQVDAGEERKLIAPEG
jgi:hypothetical protein